MIYILSLCNKISKFSGGIPVEDYNPMYIQTGTYWTKILHPNKNDQFQLQNFSGEGYLDVEFDRFNNGLVQLTNTPQKPVDYWKFVQQDTGSNEVCIKNTYTAYAYGEQFLKLNSDGTFTLSPNCETQFEIQEESIVNYKLSVVNSWSYNTKFKVGCSREGTDCSKSASKYLWETGVAPVWDRTYYDLTFFDCEKDDTTYAGIYGAVENKFGVYWDDVTGMSSFCMGGQGEYCYTELTLRDLGSDNLEYKARQLFTCCSEGI